MLFLNRVSVRVLQAAEAQLEALCQAPECLLLLLQIVVEPQVNLCYMWLFLTPPPDFSLSFRL